jgi:cell division protein FtsW (lipid II flippase)
MQSVEKGYQKYAWILIAVLGVAFIFDALVFFSGMNPDPPLFQSLIGQSLSNFNSLHPDEGKAMTYLFHGFGLAALGLGVFTIAVSYVPYRKGEKWAWYIVWYLPIFLFLATIANYADGGQSWALDLVLLIVALAGLLLPYRKFFPKK